MNNEQRSKNWPAGQPPPLQMRVGFEMVYDCPAPTPMILALNIHHTRAPDLVRPDLLASNPTVPVTAYRDLFGNWCSRLVAPRRRFVLRTDTLVSDSGLPEAARIHPGFSFGLPLLRNRSTLRDCLTALWPRPHRLGAGAGNL